jgi:hypothetical protein
VELEIDSEHLERHIPRQRGGQHVNTTDSAVLITQRPTGIVVQCHNERSRAANKDRLLRLTPAGPRRDLRSLGPSGHVTRPRGRFPDCLTEDGEAG